MYCNFIQEYIDLGYAKILKTDEIGIDGAYYMPHYGVFKPDSSSTKLRVVFNASAKTTTNLSLNDVLMDAPIVQSPLFDIIVRWRMPKYAFTADTRQMYKQVLMHPAHTKYLRCLFRDDRTQPIMDLELLRVTYGVGPAGFLATRSLIQLAKDEQNDFPKACEVVLKSFYVDDVLTGADTLEEAQKLRKDLLLLLGRGGFKLHKWCANEAAILEGVPLEDREKQMCFEKGGVIKTLGVLWDPANDVFMYRVKPMNDCSLPQTKRHVLSEIARLFDPLGVLGPTIVLAEIIMQMLWLKKIDWDESIPIIPRRVTVNNTAVYEIHGFSDASRSAYGCCVYLRCITEDGIIEVKLLCGKSRVAPLKELNREEKEGAPLEALTMPRLEQRAAALLADQVKKVREILGSNISRVILRSDSTIVLSWIKSSKPNLPVFVRNRIAEIRKLSCDAEWLHVGTKENPADLVSRGVLPIELMKSDLWWNGPKFLRASITEETLQGKTKSLSEEVITVTAITVPEAELYKNVLRGEPVNGKIRNLNPIYDPIKRLLRVGGRLKNAILPLDQKHPLILPEKNRFTDSIIEAIRREELHVGPNGLLAKI
ncbi:uncharacterized protein LOC129728701 [Wyeomyia smithii]|uniref:uncharacterized protein LOC129728701 n=1 Tax=Wyeomyia smithii TaxID=174621 RepID=UPI002467E57B|nr:uncharacterized protein LOC129728701 [Wyeomyia smithii]